MIVIVIYRRVVMAIAVSLKFCDHFTSTLYGCNINIMWPADCKQCHVSARRSPTYIQLFAAGACKRVGMGLGWKGRDVTSTGVCVTHSVEKSWHSVGGLLQLQAYNTGQTTSAIRLYSRTLLVSEGKAVLQLSTA